MIRKNRFVCLSVCHFVLVFFSPFSIAITSLGEERELILVLFVLLFGLCLFGFVDFLFLLRSGKGCGLWLWHSLDFSLTFLFFLQFSKRKHKITKQIQVPIPLLAEVGLVRYHSKCRRWNIKVHYSTYLSFLTTDVFSPFSLFICQSHNIYPVSHLNKIEGYYRYVMDV